MSTRLWLTILAIALLAVTGAISCGSAESESIVIRYGGQYYPGEFLLYGYPELWEKHGVEVEHTLFSSGAGSDCETGCQLLLWGWMPLGFGLFVLDRMQQFALMIAAALAASATTRTTRTGLVVGSLAALGVWSLEIAWGMLVLMVHPGHPARYWAIPVTVMTAPNRAAASQPR